MNAIGHSFPRADGAAKAAGQTLFSFDYAEPGTLVGKLLRSPVAAGRIVRLDTARARAMPGVRAVVTAGDVPAKLAGWIIRDTPMFASDVVRYIGEPIAAVAADSLEEAVAALSAIQLEIVPTAAVCTIEAAIALNAPLVHPHLKAYHLASGGEGGDYPRYGNIAAESASLGDAAAVEAEFARAHRVVEDEFRTQRQYQGYLEPKNALGVASGHRLTVHTGSQWPHNVRTRIAQYFDVPPSRVRVIGHPYGGGFGGKLDTAVEPHALALSQATGGRPVKIINTRSEDILTASCRESTIIRLRSALDMDGNILARQAECYMDNGAYTGEMAFLACFPFHFSAMSYRVGKLHAVGRLVYTNTPPTAAMRGVTAVPMYAALESHMDHIAQELSVDRREYRMRHLFRSGDAMANGQVLDDADILSEQFAAIERIVPWNGAPRKKYRGIGIAPAVWLVNPLPGAATVKLQEDGTVVVVTSANDNGSGSIATGVRQIVADALGLHPDAVLVSEPDTDIGGYDGGSQGSRTTEVAGRAALDAAVEVREKILDVAARMLQSPRETLELADGAVRVAANPGVSISLAEISGASTFTEGTIQGTGRAVLGSVPHNPGCASGLLFSTFATPTYSVHYAEVEVDPCTGNVAVLRYIVAQEAGQVVNPQSVRGQIQGGVTQGIGYALYESLRIDESGRTLENSLEAYRLPLAVDVPNVETIVTEHGVAGTFAVRGVGEPPILLPAAVIASAVGDAIGRPIHRIPITPEDVLALLQEVERESVSGEEHDH